MAIVTTTTIKAARTALITMTDAGALIRLTTMLSPAFPVGAFAFSSGLERAAADRLVTDEATLRAWLGDVLRVGPLWNDAVVLALAWRGADDADGLEQLNELVLALAGSAGRYSETTAQGRAFVAAAARIWTVPRLPDEPAYCLAVGAVSAASGIELADVLPVFLNAAVSSQIQAAIRLSVTGQQGGVSVLAALEGDIVAVATRAASATLDDLGSAALMAEISTMNHETLKSRIFRT